MPFPNDGQRKRLAFSDGALTNRGEHPYGCVVEIAWKNERKYSPVKNQDPGWFACLNDFGGDSNVVEKAESHEVAWLGMMSWWSDDCDRPLAPAFGDRQSGIDRPAATESSGQGGITTDVERQQLVVARVVADLVIRHTWRRVIQRELEEDREDTPWKPSTLSHSVRV